MKNKKGQSLIEIVFSIGIIILVLMGVTVLTVNTNKAKRISLERERAKELSRKLIEDKILEIKNDPAGFWDEADKTNKTDQAYSNFEEYLYDVVYDDGCDADKCKIIFTVKWGDNQSLSVERLFSRIGT